MRLMFSALVAVAVAVPLAQTPAPPAPAPAQSSKVWVGHYAEYEAFLKTAPILRLEGISVGVTSPHHALFDAAGLAKGAAWKPIKPGPYDGYFESYRSEIAAYRFDRVLELDMVPPTVERNYKLDTGSLQLWVENSRTYKQILAANAHSPNVNEWNFQVNRQKTFDDLVADIDDNQGNMLVDPAWNLIKIDHSRAFTSQLVQPFEIGKALNSIDRTFFARIKALDRATLQREIGPLLENGALGALLARRDAMVKGFDKLAASKGDAQVFYR
jgi:hypothetical protein